MEYTATFRVICGTQNTKSFQTARKESMRTWRRCKDAQNYGSFFLQVNKCMFADFKKKIIFLYDTYLRLIDVKGIKTTVLVDLFVVRM
jgi:hypothetical protein